MMCDVYKPNRYANQSFSWTSRVMSNRPWRGFAGPSAKRGVTPNQKHFVYKCDYTAMIISETRSWPDSERGADNICVMLLRVVSQCLDCKRPMVRTIDMKFTRIERQHHKLDNDLILRRRSSLLNFENITMGSDEIFDCADDFVARLNEYKRNVKNETRSRIVCPSCFVSLSLDLYAFQDHCKYKWLHSWS